MILYWPMAKYVDDKGDEQTLFTTDGCLTLALAKDQINIWDNAYRFRITEAWIDVQDTDNEKVKHAKIDLERTWIFSTKAFRQNVQ